MTRTPKSPAKQLAKLTPDEMRRGIDRLSKLVERVQQFDPQTVIEQYNIPQLGLLSAAIEEGLARTFGPDTLDYERYQTARVFNNGPHNYAYKVPITEVRQSLERSKQRNIALLHQAIETLEERFSETPDTELSCFRRNIFIRVIHVASIRISLKTAHNSFVGLVQHRAQKPLR